MTLSKRSRLSASESDITEASPLLATCDQDDQELDQLERLPENDPEPSRRRRKPHSSTIMGKKRLSDGSVAKSYGTLKSEGAARTMSQSYIWMLFGFIALAAYAVSLDQYTASTYETQALATSFGQHSLIATVNTVQAVFQSVSQPPFAKFCDLVGRFEAYALGVFLYTVGIILMAASPNVAAFAVGTCINQLGITGFYLINQIVIADFTPTKTRLFWSIFPSVPAVINIWVSGNISAALIANASWRWGYGMFAILVPILTTPIIFGLANSQRRARNRGLLDHVKAPWQTETWTKVINNVFWQVDAPGLLGIVAGYSLLLVPLTIVRQEGNNWDQPKIYVPILIGGLTLIAFLVWEMRFARHPILPLSLMRSRSIIFGFGIALFHPMAGAIQANYLLTWYRVAADQSILSATRLNGLTSFVGTLTAAVVGLIMPKVLRLKPFIFAGAIIQVLALGLMTRFRNRDASLAELAWLQILKGLGIGMISFPTQNAVQVACRHEHVALVTASWLAFFYISQGIGSAIGGAIWGAVLPPRLTEYLGGNSALAYEIYEDPITWIQDPANSFANNPQRDAVATAYSDSQRYILITAVSVAAVVVLLSLGLANPRLGNTISLESVEADSQVVPGALTGRPEFDPVEPARDVDDETTMVEHDDRKKRADLA